MQQPINFKTNIFLFSIIFILLGILSSCDSTSSLTDAEHVANAKDFLDKGDINASIIEFKNALQKNPENPEARRLLGINYVSLENGAAAEKELKRALDLGVAKEAILLPLADALRMQGKNQKILDEIVAPATLDASDQASLGAIRGDAWLALGKQEEAKAEFERSLEIDANSAGAKLGLARISAANSTIEQAEQSFQLTDEALKVSPEDGEIWSFQAQLYRAKGDLEKAEASYSKAIENRKTNQADRANRALARIDLKKFDAAKEDIKILKKEAPKFFLTHFAEGALALAQNKYPEAEAAFEQSLSLHSPNYAATYFLGVAHLMQGRFERAQTNIERAFRVRPGIVNSRQVLAFIKYQLKAYTEAKATLFPALESEPEDIYSLQLMGKIEIALGNTATGLEYLHKGVSLDPDSAESHLQLGYGLMLAGEDTKGIDALEEAVERKPKSNEPAIMLALSYIRAREFEKAGEAINTLKTEMPDSAGPRNLEGLLYLRQKDEAKAEKAFRAALTLSPGNPIASEVLARIAARQKKWDEARRYYQDVLTAHPQHLSTKLKLAQLYASQGKLTDMETNLAQAVQDHPDALQPRIMLARHYLRFGQPQRSQTLLEEIRPRYPENKVLLALLAEAQLDGNLTNRALETAKALARVAPQSAPAQFLLAAGYGKKGEVENMRAALERSLEIDAKYLRSRLAMVRLLEQDKKPLEAEKRLEILVKEYPGNAEVLRLKGWFALQQGRPQEGITAYQEALAKDPNTSTVRGLAKAQWRAGKREKALDTLAEWNNEHPKDVYIHYLRSKLYRQHGDQQKARERLEKILEMAPNYTMALNDLAWSLRKEQPAKAQEYIEKAVTIAPKGSRFLDTLAMVLVETSNHERALDIIRKASRLAPDNATIRYHLAMVQEKNGAIGDAVKTLSDLLSGPTDFPERKDAEAFLERIKG